MENLIKKGNSHPPCNTLISTIPFSVISRSPEDTFNFGLEIAPLLKNGIIIGLKGSLGSGKTCLIKGICRGLGIQEEITSPTYSIISEYEALIPVYHIDAYRLDSEDDFYALGGDEVIYGKGISLIEWADRLPSLSAGFDIIINIDIMEDDKRFISTQFREMK